ncbi:MAG: hypothetical protein C5B51_30925 [Terriglobia bacterium]|nr:MAG: hypothetical protein C5B51_30925 [Terriglobia bacterium]
MIERGTATEEEMVLAFLRAEINSSRFDEFVVQGLATIGRLRELIDEPNLADSAENSARRTLLDFYRGYERRILVFLGFPPDATWRRVLLEEGDFFRLRYANHPTWCQLSDGTRLVSRGAENFPQRPDDPELYQINGILEAVRRGNHFPELIAAEDNNGGLILLEGASRATAYMMDRRFHEVQALVASSQSIWQWHWF